MRRWRAAMLAVFMAACGGDGAEPSERLLHIQGTTNRITEFPTVKQGTDLQMKIYTQPAQCDYLGRTEEEKQLCMPYVDRASGEVRLSFSLLGSDQDPVPMPLTEDHVRALHDNVHIRDGQVVDMGDDESYIMGFDLVPHRPVSAKQLFILIIDGSNSMRETNSAGLSRIGQVQRALLMNSVKDAFFPRDVQTGVVIYQFTEGAPVPLTGQVEILESKRDYSAAIQESLRVRRGYTHLYGAIRYATSTLLENEQLERWLDLNDAEPTVVVLTDGFNNISNADRCADNVDGLQSLLKHLQKVRRSSEYRPRVYTVGLGRPVRANYTLPNERGTEVSAQELCGRFANVRIDGNLENQGIDNVSLEWIAAYGGGNAYVRQGQRQLGAAFESAAAKRYTWFEARYRVHPSFLRRRFVSAIELVSFATGRAEVTIHPSAWLDAPPGALADDGWTRPATFRSSLGVVLPVLGMVITLMYLGAASFNSRRVLSGRMRPPRPPKGETP